MGFQKVAKFYYAPGFHEPNGTGEALFNRTALEGLPEDLRTIVLEACKAENGRSLAESEWMNAGSLESLQKDDGVLLRFYPEDVLEALRRETEVVLGELAAKDDLSGRIHASYNKALARLSPWSRVSVQRFLAARDADKA